MFIYGINGRRQWVEVQEADKDKGGDGEDTALEGMRALLDKHKGDAMAVVGILYNENFRLRESNRQMKDRQAPDGAVVLTGEDVQAWTAYQALGKPADLKTAVEERQTLQGKLAGMERETILRNVAEVAGYKPSVLANLDRIAKAEGKTLAFDVRETQQDGKPVRMAYVKDGDKELPIGDYANANWSDFLPALTAVQGNGQQQSGTRFVTQHAGSGTQGRPDPVADFIAKQEEQRKAEKNPLIR